MAQRDDFSRKVSDTLARRAGMRCSNPECRQTTAGPQADPTKSANIGVASHITAASAGGPRYDASLTADSRSSIQNGIWLCQNCAKLIDNDIERYTTDLLGMWKTVAEDEAQAALEGREVNNPISAEIEVSWTVTNMEPKVQPKRHDYRLAVYVRNTGKGLLRDYYLELVMPTAVLTNQNVGVHDRSNDESTLIRRVAQDPRDNVYPGDRHLLIALPYFMDNTLHYGRGDVLSKPVRVRLFVHDAPVAQVEYTFREFQNF